MRVVLRDQEAVCFVPRAGASPPGVRRREVALATLDGTPVDALYFRSRRALEAFRERPEPEVYESDVRPADRFLMERFVTAAMVLHGRAERREGFVEYVDPRVRAGDTRPRLRAVSLDIETSGLDGDDRGQQLWSIAVSGADTRTGREPAAPGEGAASGAGDGIGNGTGTRSGSGRRRIGRGRTGGGRLPRRPRGRSGERAVLPPSPGRRRRGPGAPSPGRSRGPPRLPRLGRGLRPGPHHRLERRRLRSAFPRGALPPPRHRVRPRPGPRAGARPRRRGGDRAGPGAGGAGRHRGTPRRVLGIRGREPRGGRARSPRARQAHRTGPEPRRRDPRAVRDRPARPRRLQPRGLPSRTGDLRPHPPHRLHGRAEPDHGARPRPDGGIGRRLRPPLPAAPASARAGRARRRRRPRRRRREPGRPRPRLAPGALPERRPARLQEPVSEHHPHLPHRPPRPRRTGPRPGTGVRRRGLRARGRDPARPHRRSLGAPGRSEAERGRAVPARGQDPHELVLRRARRPRVPLLRSAAREQHHDARARDHPAQQGVHRGRGLRGHLRGYGLALRAARRASPERGRSRPRSRSG